VEVPKTKARLYLSFVMLALGAGLLGAAAAQGGDTGASIRKGGTFRIANMGDIGNIDPAVFDPEPTVTSLLDATCARLMNYPDKPPPEGFRLVPEVAAGYPRTSKDGKTYTFTLRRGFRFSNGARVRASAFERAITRSLELKGGGDQLVKDIAGAKRFQEGRAQNVAGIKAGGGNRLVVRLVHPDPDFPAKMTAPWFCAVPPGLPADPEGVTTFPAAGPYYVAENVRGRRMLLRRNRFYHGSRPHRVDSFVVEGQARSFDEVLDRTEQGTIDWGWAPESVHLDPNRRLIAKYGVNRSRFFLERGLTFRHYHLNTSRPLFRNNPRLRRAVNFAVNRSAVQREVEGSAGSVLTDQYLPFGLPGFRDARIYPLRSPNLRKARALARGHTRSGKAVLYTFDFPLFIAAAQVIKQNLQQIGLDVQVKPIPLGAYYDRLLNNPAEPWDIAYADWAPDHPDPYTYLNSLLDGQFIGSANLSHFDSRKYNGLLRRTARLHGAARYRAYGALDVRLARDAAPIVAISYLKEATLVSKRVDRRCIVLRPTLDLTAVCLK
jgi:peptide/nickel transport system substrate-binding protein